MRNAFGKITATLTIVERLFDSENERVGKRGYPNDGL